MNYNHNPIASQPNSFLNSPPSTWFPPSPFLFFSGYCHHHLFLLPPFLSHHCHHYGASSLRRSFIETYEGEEKTRALQLQASEVDEVFFSIFHFFLSRSLLFFLLSLSFYLFFFLLLIPLMTSFSYVFDWFLQRRDGHEATFITFFIWSFMWSCIKCLPWGATNS